MLTAASNRALANAAVAFSGASLKSLCTRPLESRILWGKRSVSNVTLQSAVYCDHRALLASQLASEGREVSSNAVLFLAAKGDWGCVQVGLPRRTVCDRLCCYSAAATRHNLLQLVLRGSPTYTHTHSLLANNRQPSLRSNPGPFCHCTQDTYGLNRNWDTLGSSKLHAFEFDEAHDGPAR